MAASAIALTAGMRFTAACMTYPRSPKETTSGMMYFPRMLEKIRLHARGELHEDYHKNLGAVKAADGLAAIFLRVHYRDLRERVLQGGTDEEILEWCFEKGRRRMKATCLSGMDSSSKLGWRDSSSSSVGEKEKEVRHRRSRLTFSQSPT